MVYWNIQNGNEPALDPETQKRLNAPLQKQGMDPKDEAFLDLVVSKVESGQLNLMQPETLINKSVYDELPPEKQGKVDFDAVNLLTTLREIYYLWKTYRMPTFQIENLVSQVRQTKERLEEISGDVYII